MVNPTKISAYLFNLSPTQRITIAKKHEEKFRVQAKENKSINGGDKKSDMSNWTTPKAEITETKVRTEVAKIANVGTGTLARYEVVMKSDDEELKQIIS